MKYARIAFVSFFILIFFLSYNQRVFSLGFFKLYSESEYSDNGFQKVQKFDPEKDTLYLPGLEDKELFESIQDLSLCRKQIVREYIYIYLTSGREYLIRSIERSYIYSEIINDIMKKNPDIPSDIALLPLLESGFDPNAVSRSNAVGLWQFLQSTSSRLDLKSNKWVEERRDIEKSTEAAIRHLRYLHKILKSWDLALAAYNGGDGQIRRAMEKTDSHNVWDLIKSGSLSRETSEYVPRFAALAIIYNNRKMFGIESEIKLPEKEKTETVKLNYQIDILLLSKLCGIDIDEIKKYNPELNSRFTPPPSENYSLRLTDASARKFYLNLGVLYAGMSTYSEKLYLDTTPL